MSETTESPVFAQALIDQRILSSDQIENLVNQARSSGRTLFRTIMEEGSVLKSDRFTGLVEQEYARFTQQEIGKHDLRMLSYGELVASGISQDWLPFSSCQAVGAVLILGSRGSTSHYATVDPFDILLKDWIVQCSGNPDIAPAFVTTETLASAVRELEKNAAAVDGDTLESGSGISISITEEEDRDIRSRIHTLPVPEMVNFFLHRAYTQKSSDIHVEPREDTLLIRNRVDGVLYEDTDLPHALAPEVVSRIKIMSGMDVAEKRRPQDGRFRRIISGAPIDVRVSSYPVVHGEKIVMRLLDSKSLRPSPSDLGFLDDDLDTLMKKIIAPHGLIMLSGPTGSGKTTTLYSCLSSIDSSRKNILTIEDPVEYRLPGVHQMQVNAKIGLTFASGLRTTLRQDPDVIMVGECRDQETAAMAVQAALTGHIVFSTIHTNNAIDVVTRLIQMGVEPFMVSSALSLSIAQRLIRTICPECKTTLSGETLLETLSTDEGITETHLNDLGIEIDREGFYAVGAGCNNCMYSGYLGRRAVYEFFEMVREAGDIIMSERRLDTSRLRKLATDRDMTSLLYHGMSLVEEGTTTIGEVVRALGE